MDTFTADILFVGIVRNCAQKLPKLVSKFESAFSDFGSVRWYLVESDSDDATVSILSGLSANLNFEFVSLGTLRNEIPNRTERLAFCRNRYINELFKNPAYEETEFVVVVDADGEVLLSKEMLTKAFNVSFKWDAFFANHKPYYYDIWALRHEFWSPNDCWQHYRFLVAQGLTEFSAIRRSVYSRMLCLKENSPAVRVQSAFGGIAVYRKEILKGAIYSGALEGKEVCEHVPLNLYLANRGAKMYIFPWVLSGTGADHMFRRSLIGTPLLFFYLSLKRFAEFFRRKARF